MAWVQVAPRKVRQRGLGARHVARMLCSSPKPIRSPVRKGTVPSEATCAGSTQTDRMSALHALTLPAAGACHPTPLLRLLTTARQPRQTHWRWAQSTRAARWVAHRCAVKGHQHITLPQPALRRAGGIDPLYSHALLGWGHIEGVPANARDMRRGGWQRRWRWHSVGALSGLPRFALKHTEGSPASPEQWRKSG